MREAVVNQIFSDPTNSVQISALSRIGGLNLLTHIHSRCSRTRQGWGKCGKIVGNDSRIPAPVAKLPHPALAPHLRPVGVPYILVAAASHDVQEMLMLWSAWMHENSPCDHGIPTSWAAALSRPCDHGIPTSCRQKKAGVKRHRLFQPQQESYSAALSCAASVAVVSAGAGVSTSVSAFASSSPNASSTRLRRRSS